MAKTVKKAPPGPAKGSVEDAANVLKTSQQEKDSAGTGDTKATEGNASDPGPGESGGQEKPAEDLQPSAGEAGTESGDQDTKAGEEPAGEPSQPYPVPTAKQIEDSAQMLAVNPELLEAFRNTLSRADEIVEERNQPAKKTVEELRADNHEKLVAIYGKDFVTAKKGNNRGYYSRLSWNKMGKNHLGWTEITDVMPEVAQAAKA